MAVPSAPVARALAPPVLLAVGAMLIAGNLRPAITGVGPLLGDIRADTGMSAAVAGLLTTLPLVAFATISPLAAGVARRAGIERTLLAALVVLAGGIALRSAGTTLAIFAGTAILGAAIAVGNVLLPALVKQDFPERTGLMTGLYTTALAAMASVAIALAVVLADDLGLGWRGSLAAWAIPALLAAVVWFPYARRSRRVPPSDAPPATIRLRRSWLAWQVTLFMGLQSVLFYSVIAWLPTLLEEDGISAGAAGWLASLVQFASLAATIGIPIVAGRMRDQRALVVASCAACLLGFAGLGLLGADLPLLWVPPLGLGLGGVFGLALMFFVLRAPDARHTGALSGMAQSVGYALAAAGPLALGLLRDATGSWDSSIVVLLLCTLGALVTGLAAGRDAKVA